VTCEFVVEVDGLPWDIYAGEVMKTYLAKAVESHVATNCVTLSNIVDWEIADDS